MDWHIFLTWSSRSYHRCTLARWDDPRKTLLCSHFFRLARTDVCAQVRLQFLFTSRAFIYMVRISWGRQPMLLFSDIHRVDPVSFQCFHTGLFWETKYSNGASRRAFCSPTFVPQWDAVPSRTSVHEFCSLQEQEGRTCYVEACPVSVNRFRLVAGGCCRGLLLPCPPPRSNPTLWLLSWGATRLQCKLPGLVTHRRAKTT